MGSPLGLSADLAAAEHGTAAVGGRSISDEAPPPGMRWGTLFRAITAFTAAHSITLALATLGVVRVPSAPVEAVIALSIMFAAFEIVHARAGWPGLSAGRPWLVAFLFGSLHGFGFAGALSAVGLPPNAVALALHFFNIGVEIGQLLFIAMALVVIGAVRRVAKNWPGWMEAVPSYVIGGSAAFWVIQRLAAL